MIENDAIVAEFLVESRENLDRFERDLIALEGHPSGRETLANLFRAIHSIKGATGFLGLSKLGAAAHAGESLLSLLRDQTVVINPAIATALLELVDAMRRVLASVERDGTEGDADHAPLIERLNRLCAAEPGGLAGTAAPAASEPGLPRLAAAADPVASDSSGNVRVDVKHLDTLMNLVGELVLARNEMLRYSADRDDPVLQDSSQRLNVITAQLQEGIVKTRMQPIDNVWRTLPRLVRDSALLCRKDVRLEMEGRDTELDKTLIEAIKDPLTHLLRNCVDHGFETPAGRAAAGKPAEGRLLLRAFHEGGQVNIEVSDDGAGIDVARVKQRAVEAGLISADQGREMADQEVTNLIFLPGFSTAAHVTSLSGRGVGMDVVKTNIERIGGKVAVHSERGRGTTFKIRIPLTLTIMPALIVSAGGDRYAIPQVAVLELMRLEGDEVKTGVQMFQDVAVCRVRGDVLPLVRLDVELGTCQQAWDPLASDAVTIVILQADDQRFGVVVDDAHDTQEIVVKSLGEYLTGISTFAGATTMGDGRVVLILDVAGLAVHARVVNPLGGDDADAATLVAATEQLDITESLLLFEGEDHERMALPLAQVVRLERFAPSAIEQLNGGSVVQYMGGIMPLVGVSELLGRGLSHREQPRASHNGVQAIVCSERGKRIGVVVYRILDTVEDCVWVADGPPGHAHLTHSAVIQGRVTEIIDLRALGFDADASSEPHLVQAVA